MRLRLPMPVEEVQIQSIDSSVNNLGTAVEVRSSREAHTFLVNKAPKGNEVIVDRFLHRGHCSTVYLEYGRREENYRELASLAQESGRKAPTACAATRGASEAVLMCSYLRLCTRFQVAPKKQKLDTGKIGGHRNWYASHTYLHLNQSRFQTASIDSRERQKNRYILQHY